jgi:transposase
MEVATIGLDLAKSIFQVHGADASGGVAFRKPLRRDKVLTFFAGLPPCTVAMEACGGAHYWAREIGKAGHGASVAQSFEDAAGRRREARLKLEPYRGIADR